MLEDLFVAKMNRIDKEYLFVEGTLGDFVIEDFNIYEDKNFITIKGKEWDRCIEDRTGLIVGLKIDSNTITDYEDLSGRGGDDICIGLNDGEHYVRFYKSF